MIVELSHAVIGVLQQLGWNLVVGRDLRVFRIEIHLSVYTQDK